jgi:hypothetical protein
MTTKRSKKSAAATTTRREMSLDEARAVRAEMHKHGATSVGQLGKPTAKRSKKMPAALLEHFAAMKGKRVELNGKTIKPGKRRARVLKAAPGTRHAAVRFNNPGGHADDVRDAVVRSVSKFGIPSRRVMIMAGPNRTDAAIISAYVPEYTTGRSTAAMADLTSAAARFGWVVDRKHSSGGYLFIRQSAAGARALNPHTFKGTGRVSKVENVRGPRSAKYLMRKAAEAKREGKEFHGDVTKKGTHRTVRMASARLMGFTADKPAKPREAKAAGTTPGLGLMDDSLAAMGAY